MTTPTNRPRGFPVIYGATKFDQDQIDLMRDALTAAEAEVERLRAEMIVEEESWDELDAARVKLFDHAQALRSERDQALARVAALESAPRWALSEKPHNFTPAELAALVNRERAKGAAAERAAVVSYLRTADNEAWDGQAWADDIEAGAHRIKP